jgi:hypothetical protein
MWHIFRGVRMAQDGRIASSLGKPPGIKYPLGIATVRHEKGPGFLRSASFGQSASAEVRVDGGPKFGRPRLLGWVGM